MNQITYPKKNILIIHQNFPGQFRSIAFHLWNRSDINVVGVGKDTAPGIPGFPIVKYKLHRQVSPEVHPYNFRTENAILHGQAVLKVLLDLKSRGFNADVVLAHPGWGESLFVKEVFPNAKLIHLCEWYYKTHGSDFGFDPEFRADLDAKLQLNTTNSFHLLNLENCDVAISPTHWQKSQFPEAYQSKIQVIHEGVPTHLLKPNPTASFKLPNGKLVSFGDKVITYVVRNLEPYRGFHIFMRMLPKLLMQHPDCEIVVVGGDKVSYGNAPRDAANWRMKMLRELASNHPNLQLNRVHFLGQVSYANYQVILQVSAVHVYLTYPFVLSWSLLEAMASGCAIVASNTPPVREVMRHETEGLLVDFFSASQLINAINTILTEKVLAQKLRQGAMKKAQGYDLKRGLERYLTHIFDRPDPNVHASTLVPGEEKNIQLNRRKSDKLHNLGLSSKEQLVLKFLMTGMEDRDISSQLKISQKTVNHHVSNIISKLGANNRTHVLAKIFSSDHRNSYL